VFKTGKVNGFFLILVLAFSVLVSSPAGLSATCCHTNKSLVNSTIQNPATNGSTNALFKWLEFFEDNVNWTENTDTKYMGYILGNTTLTDLQNGVSALANKTSTSWQDVLIWSARLHKYGTDDRELIQWALDNSTIMDNGLPQVALDNGKYGKQDYPYFAVTSRELLWGYYWAIEYGDNAELAKWNLTTAYNSLRTAWVTRGSGFLVIHNDSTTYDYLARYYDEKAETMACFLQFYAFNVTNALQDAQTEWNFINTNYWVSSPAGQEHYSYRAGGNTEWECEAGGFLEIANWLKYYNSSLPYTDRLITDFQNRFLANAWNSYQWTTNTSIPNYCVVHANPSNSECRLGNTIMAWSSIIGIFDLFDSGSRQNVTNLLGGFSGYDPAWKLLFNATCGLFSQASFQFRLTSAYVSPYNNLYTSYAAALILSMGIVPINATLAVPIEEMHYEYIYNMLDHDLFNIDLAARNVTLSIGKAGTFAFLFNSTVYQNFSQNGVYRVQFDSDWSSINSVARINDLPSNRIYLFENAPKIPELSFFHILAVLMMATLLPVIFHRRKRMKKPSRATCVS